MSALGVTTVRRAELKVGQTSLTTANDLAIRHALEAAGVEFIDANGGGPGVRLRSTTKKRKWLAPLVFVSEGGFRSRSPRMN